MHQEQSTLSKIKAILSAEEILFQDLVLSCYIDAYFPKYKLAVDVDEQGHNSIEIDIGIILLRLGKYKITLLNQLKN